MPRFLFLEMPRSTTLRPIPTQYWSSSLHRTFCYSSFPDVHILHVLLVVRVFWHLVTGIATSAFYCVLASVPTLPYLAPDISITSLHICLIALWIVERCTRLLTKSSSIFRRYHNKNRCIYFGAWAIISVNWWPLSHGPDATCSPVYSCGEPNIVLWPDWADRDTVTVRHNY